MKTHLNVIGQNSNIVEGVTCFSVLEKNNRDCERRQCHNWIDQGCSHNCVMIEARKGPHTLQDIGKMFGLTRMRICQIEKSIYEKIRNAS